MKRSLPVIVVVLAALIMGGLFYQFSVDKQVTGDEIMTSLEATTLLSPAKALAEFSLVQHTGKPFDKHALKGKHSLLFFGFTHCPDICPSTLQQFKQIKAQLVRENVWGKVRVVFVTVDPERDTVEKMAQYVPYFDKEFIGVTGSLEQTSSFAKLLSMPYEFSEKDENGYYSVDHSGSVILLDELVNLRGIISPPLNPNKISSDLITILKETG